MCHRSPDIGVAKLLEVVSQRGARDATKLFVGTVRKSIEKAAPLQKRNALTDDFRRGRRRRGENINDFIVRRSNEHERLRDLTNNHTQVSEGVRAFFLLGFSGAIEEQHKHILASATYLWEDIVEAMKMQLDTSSDPYPASQGAASSSWVRLGGDRAIV